MPARRIRRSLVHPLVQGLVDRKLQIDDRTAAFADEMVVGPDVGVESIVGAAEIDLLDQSLLHQDVKVPVDRTHAEVGKLPLQPFVDPVSRGVPPGRLKQLQDAFPLPASLVPVFSIDVELLISNNRNYS